MSSLGVISAEEPDECELCGAFEETRPYGPNGERICFKCGQANKDVTEKQMRKYLFGEDIERSH